MKEICEDNVDILNKYLENETCLGMVNLIFGKRCEMGDFYQNAGSLLPVMHPMKIGKENLWTYILWPLMIGECLESKDILDEKFFREGGQDRRVLYHKELLRNVSMKYYIFEFLLE